MASESREEAVTVDLPDDLGDWLDDRAARLGVSRDEVVRQLLASYRAADSLEGDLDPADLLDADEVETDVADAVDDRVDSAVEAAVRSALPEVTEVVAERLADRFTTGEDLAALDDDFREKIEDVRERVVQVKQETDAKAPADHTHEELDRVGELATELDDLTAEYDALREDLKAESTDREAADDDLRERLADAEDKLTRVAWAVNDLKDDSRGRDSRERALDRLKRAAAQEGVATAACENCGESVRIALLTDPECPHCRAAVSDVRPTGGLFRSGARLVSASQLEAGDGDER